MVTSFFDYKDVQGDEFNLIFSFEFINKEIVIEGKSKNLSTIQTPNGKSFAIGIVFDEDKISIEYTMLIHDYFNET